MIDENEFLIDGERRLGRYTVVLLQQTSSGWLPSVLQLDALVTNYRLLLRPHRRKYEPASLPAEYIRSIAITRHARFHVLAIELMTEHLLYLMMSSGKLDDLYDDMHAMLAPPPRFKWDEGVARRDIERLINFFANV